MELHCEKVFCEVLRMTGRQGSICEILKIMWKLEEDWENNNWKQCSSKKGIKPPKPIEENCTCVKAGSNLEQRHVKEGHMLRAQADLHLLSSFTTYELCLSKSLSFASSNGNKWGLKNTAHCLKEELWGWNNSIIGMKHVLPQIPAWVPNYSCKECWEAGGDRELVNGTESDPSTMFECWLSENL